jgi:hypothetical protein
MIIFTNILEYLTNLRIVLNSLKQLMNEKTELIITVPNDTILSRFIGEF